VRGGAQAIARAQRTQNIMLLPPRTSHEFRPSVFRPAETHRKQTTGPPPPPDRPSGRFTATPAVAAVAAEWCRAGRPATPTRQPIGRAVVPRSAADDRSAARARRPTDRPRRRKKNHLAGSVSTRASPCVRSSTPSQINVSRAPPCVSCPAAAAADPGAKKSMRATLDDSNNNNNIIII